MNFIKRLFIFVFMVLMLSVGVLFLVMASNLVPSGTWTDIIGVLSGTIGAQISLAVIGAVFVILGIILSSRGFKGITGSKLITFQNPDGEVTVSLSAIENYVARVAKEIPGIKDIKSKVAVNKRGIKVVSAIAIEAGTNIPEVTESIQMIVKGKIQDMIGVEEAVNIEMRVSKILGSSQHEEGPAGRQVVDQEPEPQVPFRGI